ncbi:MAG: hypothetical protein HYV37_00225 [Candidatus Levyibacteriota bacterium]|nr:MAG: hypothetical protein HYV37_00225 [Candidatus Levybacteria bacterium]
MADLNVAPEHLVPAEGAVKPAGATAVAPESSKGREFLKSEFVKEFSTGTTLNKGKVEVPGKIEGKSVYISPETEAKYTNFLMDYLPHVYTALQRNPSLRDNPLFQLDIPLVEALTTDGKADLKKIDEFFDDAKGWILATEVITRFASQAKRVSGLVSEISPQGRRTATTEGLRVRMGDARFLNKLWRDRIVPGFMKIRANPVLQVFAGYNISGVLGIGAAAGFGAPPEVVIGGAAAIAGAEGLGMVGAGAVRSFKNSGTEIVLSTNIGVFNNIKNNPAEKAYVQALLGVDIDHLEEDPAMPGRLRQIPEMTPVTNRDADDIRDEALRLIYARRDFFKDIGISAKRADTLPEETIWRNTVVTEGFERVATVWEEEMIKAFKPDSGGVLDKWKRNEEDPDFCRDTTIIGSSPDYVNNLDTAGNIERFNRARQEVMMRITMEHVGQTLNGQAINRTKTALKGKIKAIEDGGDKEKRKAELTKQKAELQREKDRLTPQQSKIDAYKEKAAVVNTGDRDFKREFRSDVAAGRDIEGTITRIDGEIDAYEITIRDRKDNNDANINAAITVEIGKLPPVALTGNPKEDQPMQRRREERETSIGREIRKNYEEQTTLLTAQLNSRQTQVERLLTLQQQDQEYRQNVRANDDELLADAKEDLGIMEAAYKAYSKFTAAPPAGWNISEVILLSQNPQELMVTLNGFYAKDLAAGVAAVNRRGWPVDQNNVASNRERVIFAIAEIKARRLEAEDPQTSVRGPDYTQVTGWTITEDQLRILSENALNSLINDRWAATGGTEGWQPADNTDPANITRLRNAVAESRNRLLVRYIAVVAEKTADFDAQIKALDEASLEIDAETTEEQLKPFRLTAALLDRQAEVFTKSSEIKTETAKYIDLARIGAADTTYSQAERGANQPKGYYEIMDVLFDFQKRESGDRGAYFQEISNFIPPQKLAELLNYAFDLGLVSGGPAAARVNINNALNQLRAGIDSNDISYSGLYAGFRNIINRLGEEAIAA